MLTVSETFEQTILSLLSPTDGPGPGLAQKPGPGLAAVQGLGQGKGPPSRSQKHKPSARPTPSKAPRAWWVHVLLRIGNIPETTNGPGASLRLLRDHIDNCNKAYMSFKGCRDVSGYIMLTNKEQSELEAARTRAIQVIYQLTLHFLNSRHP